MIEQLVTVLEQRFEDLTAEEIADILWLTLQQWQTSTAKLPEVVSNPSSVEPSPKDERTPFDRSSVQTPLDKPLELPQTSRQHQMAGLTTTRSPRHAQSQTTSAPEVPLAIPDAPALRQSLELLKALRPLIRRVPSAEAKSLDVSATVRAIAETDLWLLKLQPVLEPWLELAIVVDATASMVIWQHTVLSLRRVLAQSGVFRDVRMWSLENQDSTDRSTNQASPELKLCIRPGFGPAAALQAPCRPQELLDPNGRRLILVISDCIAPRWETQQIREILQVWAAHGPMALIQVLPEWLWARTALREVAKGQVYSLTAGQTNQSLTFLRRERWRRKNPPGVKVPVITLEPAVAKRWSQMVAGKTTVSAPALFFSSVNPQRLAIEQEVTAQAQSSVPTGITPQQRLEQFRNFSSPMARRLVGLLAACPEVNLPIVRMVQAAMLPESQQVHVAEVLLGGLFKPQTEITAHTPANQVQYVFHEGVQPLVQDTVPPDRAFAALSTWLNHRFGYSLEDFRAYVTSERIEQVKPFAGIMLDVLKRRGSEYAAIVNNIERVYQPQYSTFTELTEHKTATQDYEIRSRGGSSGVAVIAIHGGNLQPGTTQIADAVAGSTHSFYSFVSLKPEIDQTLYIPSTQFDEPTAREMVGNAQVVLSIHGCEGKAEFIKVGGLDRERHERVRAELRSVGFSISDESTGGTNPANICNRGSTGQGIQLEISRGLRDRLMNSAHHLQDSIALPQLVDLVGVLQRCLAFERKPKPNFEYDIYISYAHIDNQPLAEGQEGWISDFHRSLEKRLAQLLGDRPRIWRDPKLQGNDYFAEAAVGQLSKAAVLVSIFSPRYVRSEWCMRELRVFQTAASQARGIRVANKARIFKVIKTPVSLDEQPEEMQQLLGYEFYQHNSNGSLLEFNRIFGSEAEQRYWISLNDLAYDISQVLRGLSEENESSAAETEIGSNRIIASVLPSSGIAVYLAETSYDLQNERDKIKRELQRRGHLVLPDQTLPTYYPDFERVVTENLERCKLSIHLIGARYGVIPEGAERSQIALQHDLAVAQNRSRPEFSTLVWMPVGLQTEEARQQELIQSLQDDPDWLQTGIETLKTVILDRLTVLAQHLENGATDDAIVRVYLICDQTDLKNIVPLYNYLFDCGWEVTLPVFEGDEAEVREDHRDNLVECNAVLIYYGNGNDLWLRTKLRDLQKVAGYGRTKPLLAKAIYVAAPETPIKQRLRTNEAIVLKCFDTFTPMALAPFMDQITQSQGEHPR